MLLPHRLKTSSSLGQLTSTESASLAQTPIRQTSAQILPACGAVVLSMLLIIKRDRNHSLLSMQSRETACHATSVPTATHTITESLYVEYYGRSVSDRPLLSNGSCRRAVGLWLGPIRGTHHGVQYLCTPYFTCVRSQVLEKGGRGKLLFPVHAVTHLAGVKFQRQPTPHSPLAAASGMGTIAASLTSRLGPHWSSVRLAAFVARS